MRIAEIEFYARGVHAVGISDVAEAASASKLSIYRHFGSKAGLVHEIARDRSERVQAWVRSGIGDRPVGLPRIAALFDLFGQWYAEDGFAGCGVVNATIDTRGTDETTSDVMKAHLDLYLDVLTENLAAEVAAEYVHPLARQILALLEGATLIVALTHDPHASTDAKRAAESLIHSAPKS